MKKTLLLTFLLVIIQLVNAQAKIEVLKTIEDLSFWSKNVIPISSDTNCSSFLIRVKDEVKPHYHDYHTEHIYVVNGTATVNVGDSVFKAKPGDLIVIPPKTVHSVKVHTLDSFEVISIQSPEFKGKDRIWVE